MRYEITEATVGLLDRVTNVSRSLATAVAKKITEYFGWDIELLGRCSAKH